MIPVIQALPHPSSLILRQQLRRRAPPRFVLEIDVSELLSVSVTYDVVVRLQLGRPGCGEAKGHQKSDGLSRVTAPLSQRRGS